MKKNGITIKELGEFPFIDSIVKDTIQDNTTVRVGIGDDAAVYIPSEATDQVVTIDTMVEGVHFSPHTTSPFDMGYRLGTANLSDLAAMGAKARHLLISVAAPVDYNVEVLHGVYEGIKALCRDYKVNLIGGDTVSTKGPLVLTITAIGEVPRQKATLRSGAQENDYIGVTNYVGSAAVGLAALQCGEEGYSFSKEAHQRPKPQLALGEYLRELGIHAMNDISDGLASELNEIARASKKVLYIDKKTIPLHEETLSWARAKKIDSTDFALYGGEDFQLVFTFPKELLSTIDAHPLFTVIGSVGGAGEEVYMKEDGKQSLIKALGYNHFAKEEA